MNITNELIEQEDGFEYWPEFVFGFPGADEDHEGDVDDNA